MIKNKFKIIYLLAFLALSSCSNDDDVQTLRDKTIKELTLPAKVSLVDYDSSNTEFLSDTLSKQLNGLTGRFPGEKPQLKLSYDQKWSIGYKIKSDKDFDIMVVEQGKNSKIRCLITISKKNPIQIISSIIVALDNYKESIGLIESEVWTSDISKDLLVKVNKQYEKIKNSETNKNSEADINDKNVALTEETYKILSSGKIEIMKKNYQAKIDSTLNNKYDAIIFYMVKASDESPQLSEDWLLYNNEIQTICNENNIQTQYCYENFEKVSITNSKGKIIETLNIKPFVDEFSSGYIVAKNDKKPMFIPFSKPVETLPLISKYFGVELLVKQ